MSSAVSLCQVVKHYRRGKESVEVLHELNLEIPEGEFVSLMGPSGSGKTTILNLVGGLDHADSGRVIVSGEHLESLSGGALAKWPLFNGYWEDKVYDTSDLTLPIYALASYSSGNHGSGTVRGWNKAASKDKWIRFHPTQEWFDLYTPRYIDDLQRFYDRYLKGIDNGWEKTPRARVSILTYGNRFEPVS